MQFTRREFLKLSGNAFGAVVAKELLSGVFVPESTGEMGDVPTAGLVNDRIFRTQEGLIPVSSYRVVVGDTLTGIAAKFHTQLPLILEVNKPLNPDRIFLDQILKIPKYPGEPMGFIPEPGIIRHLIRPEDTTYTISRRYGISELPVVFANLALTGKRNRLPEGKVLTIHGVLTPSLVPVEIAYEAKDMLPFDVMEGLVQRVANVFSYYLGGVEPLEYLKKAGVKISNDNPGFLAPNNIGVQAYDDIAEGEILCQLGHEMWHEVPFPWWSAGADEGTAAYVASEWVIRRGEFASKITDPYYDGYYDTRNTLALREKVFSDYPFENRILATEAWKRIENAYPGTISFLTQIWAQTEQGKQGSHDATPVETVQNLVSDHLGAEAWNFISEQHILFTK